MPNPKLSAAQQLLVKDFTESVAPTYVLESMATTFTRRIQKKAEAAGNTAILMTPDSLLKWLCGLVWLLFMIGHLITKSVGQ
jgi:hypothetical protein